MTDRFEPPPQVPARVDENGNVVMTQQDWQRLRDWLERLVQHIARIT